MSSHAPRAVALIAVLASAWAAAAPASAQTTVDAERVVVRSPSGSVLVERSPLRIEFRDPGGRAVLRQVENARPAPFPQPPAPNALPAGAAQPVKGPTLYSPLTFMVGGSVTAQHQAGIYAGNQLAGIDGGTVFSATEVTRAEPRAGGARLTTATNDPSGRTLTVDVTPHPQGGFRVSVRPSSPDGIATMADAFVSAAGEAFRGFGGRHNELDQRGGDFYNWIEQENSEPNDLSPGATALGQREDKYLFPNGPTAAYYVHSLFVSSRDYGFLFDRTELTRFRLASDREDAWQVSVAAAGLDYVVVPGDAPTAVRALAKTNGVHPMPPRFALRPQMDRSLQALSDTSESYIKKVEADLAAIDKHKVPLGVYRIEGWLGIPEPQLRAYIDAFHRRGIKVTAYFKAFISRGDTLFDEQEEFDEALAEGYLAKTPAGTPFLFNGAFGKDVAGLFDVTNPDARRWWEARVRRAFDLGFDGFQEDFGEQTQASMVFHDGSTGQTMHNRYPILFHKLNREIMDRYSREHPGREFFTFVRSGFSGSPGSSAYENSNFPGDFQSTWDKQANGLGASARDMLNRGIGGAVGYSTDIGGYLDVTNDPPTKELLLRWAQWAALSPMFRLHNGAGTGARPPWFFDDETIAVYSRYARLHDRAIPLIQRLWREAMQTGMPITRPLWLAFPGDAEAARQDQQWMLGEDVLVAPIVSEGATSRRVYFPRGCWEHGETGARHRGPAKTAVPAALDELPYFFRCGTKPLGVADGEAARLPASRSCTSRRSFRIRLRRAPRGDRLVGARVYVAGRRVRVVRGRRLRAPVDLRGMPRGRVVVRIVARTARGRVLRSTRAYRTCVPRRR